MTAFARLIGPARLRGGSTGFRPEATGAAGVVTAMMTGARLGYTTSELVAE